LRDQACTITIGPAMNRRRLLHCACATLAGVGTPTAFAQPAAAAASAPMSVATLAGQTLDGKPYELRQDMGKVVLVFFWSTGCPVCRDKMPELRLNYEAWRNKGFQLLAVSVDKSLGELRAYDSILNRVVAPTQRFPWLWRGAADHRDSFGSLASMPTSFLVDRKGLVVRQMRGRIEASLWDDIAELVLT
jgi:thiol-disulfide isomerase/thioredoxin